MILRANLTIPKAGAYIVAVQSVPDSWLVCNVPNLLAFANRRPGFGFYMAGGVESTLLGGLRMIREAEVTAW
jgi:hypothetical protein